MDVLEGRMWGAAVLKIDSIDVSYRQIMSKVERFIIFIFASVHVMLS